MSEDGRVEAQSLYEAICEKRLPPEDFSHTEHIRLAWYYLTTWPLEEACERFDTDFRAYVHSIGADTKYHHTITHGLLRLLDTHLGSEQTRTSWAAFRKDAAPAFANALEVLNRFWSSETLFSDEARKGWAEPDQNPLPRRD